MVCKTRAVRRAGRVLSEPQGGRWLGEYVTLDKTIYLKTPEINHRQSVQNDDQMSIILSSPPHFHYN